MAENKTKKGILVTIGLLILTKLKWLLAVLKFSKFGGTLISLVVSLAGYAVFFGWGFAAAIIYLIFVHEMGHLVAAKIKGIKTSPAVFIPFLGAVIGIKEQPKDAATEAFLAYGGPFAGLISIFPAIILFYLTHQPYWALVVVLGAMLNLFNLFPVSPLDGGRIVGVLSTKIWFVALIALLVLIILSPTPIMFLILIFGFLTWWNRAREGYKRKKIDLRIEAKQKMIESLEKFKDDIFYVYGFDDEDGPMINETMIMYHLRTLRQHIADIEMRLSDMKKWYVPFIQDKDRLKKDALIYEMNLYEELTAFLQKAPDYSSIERKINQTNQEITALEKEKSALKEYYKAKPSTKWKVLIAYVLLAACLSFLFVYARQVLDVSLEYIYE
ncbi:Zn-dependent protease [Scopulibacillus daqui]|uniref:Zn-dependent protease n=1 Tax=Scopulibacillus daqui TaxID=1469162 RepID=A0ABS2PYX0_9BACL|nr:site-2 protease family protein [Scopulibacillus daqui]MBM7644659.1 Zn-dependent protease [Scopulibacillus daqui]